MNYKNYCKKLLITFFITIFIVMIINYLVNPFNIFKQRIFPDTFMKPEATLQERLTKPIALKINKSQIDTVFIGTSRVDFGININDYENLTHKTAVNIALKGLTFEEIEPMINLVLATHPEIKNIYLSVDFYTFHKYVEDKQDVGRVEITQNPELEINELSFALLSMKSITNSVWAIIKNIIGIEKRMYHSDGYQHIYVNPDIKNEFAAHIFEYGEKYKQYELDEEKSDKFKKYIKNIQDKGINVKIFIMPTHIVISSQIDKNGKRNVYKKWCEELSELCDVYDFNIENKYTTEEIKPDMQYFLDGSHASHKFGKIIIKDLLSDYPEYAVLYKNKKYGKEIVY